MGNCRRISKIGRIHLNESEANKFSIYGGLFGNRDVIISQGGEHWFPKAHLEIRAGVPLIHLITAVYDRLEQQIFNNRGGPRRAAHRLYQPIHKLAYRRLRVVPTHTGPMDFSKREHDENLPLLLQLAQVEIVHSIHHHLTLTPFK